MTRKATKPELGGTLGRVMSALSLSLARPAFALAALLSVGCMSNKIKTFAANDLQCSFGQVAIEDLDNGAYHASGCGRSGDFYCNGKTCVRADGSASGEDGGAPKKGAAKAKAPAEDSAEPGYRWVKKGPVRFKLKTSYLKDGSDGETYKDEDARHVVKLKIQAHEGTDDDYLDHGFPDAKRLTDGGTKLATKMDGGGARRLTVTVLVREGKAYELSCTFEDAASTKPDPGCLEVLRSLKVSGGGEE